MYSKVVAMAEWYDWDEDEDPSATDAPDYLNMDADEILQHSSAK